MHVEDRHGVDELLQANATCFPCKLGPLHQNSLPWPKAASDDQSLTDTRILIGSGFWGKVRSRRGSQTDSFSATSLSPFFRFSRGNLVVLVYSELLVSKGLSTLPLVALLRTLVANQRPGRPVK